MSYIKFLSVLVLLTILGCEEGNHIDKASVKKAIEDNKIHRLTEADLMKISTDLGGKVSTSLGGLSKKEDSLDYIKQLEDLHINVSYYTPYSNKTGAFTEIEKQLIEAYEYNLENNLEIEENIQPLNELEILYSSLYLPKGNPEAKQIIFITFDKTYLLKGKGELLE